MRRLTGERTAKKQEESTTDRHSRRAANSTVALAVIAFITLAAACATAVFVYGEFQEMNAQTGLMNRAARQARKDSAASSVTTAQQITILQGQLAQQTKALRMDQRPWLKFEFGGAQAPGDDPSAHVLPPFVAGQPVEVPIRVSNIGKITAEKINGTLLVEIVPDDKEPLIPKEYLISNIPGEPKTPGKPVAGQSFLKASLYPKEITVNSFSRVRADGTENLVTPSEADEIKSGAAHIYLVGEVWYSDVFGIRHWTKFCETSFTKTLRPEDSSSPQLKCLRFGGVDHNQGGQKPN